MNVLSINLCGAGGPEKMEWIKRLKRQHNIMFIAIQETQIQISSNLKPTCFWGQTNCDFDFMDAHGRSGGLLCLWDPGKFSKSSVCKNRNFLQICGKITGHDEPVTITNIYGPQDPSAKRSLWRHLESTIDPSTPHLLIGDFNAVRHPSDRLNSDFCQSEANQFNSFIQRVGLKEFSLGGRRYTYMSKSGDKFSRIDRAFATPSLMRIWSDFDLLALPRECSDHCYLLLRSNNCDFGATPFRFFSSWFNEAGYTEVVQKALNLPTDLPPGAKPDKVLAVKLKKVKELLRAWSKSARN
ncbi:hypothetical protein SSX86_023377 [Deinandra increscens subsp. villosa]|uniref:Endonuclease/exonuclease/phosphatase domain-containing protein n=1 Tax=Deinandra increscens subsp. villosa TaxID=3103831 RepID=A0AAP0CQJ7_9ASTR